MTGGLLAGQFAVVTAGTSGIGRAVVERFLAEGAEVLTTGMTAARIDEARNTWGDRVHVLRADASRLDGLDELAAAVRATGLGVDVLVANAGRDVDSTPVAETDATAFDHVSDLNFRGTFFTVQRLVPLLNDHGRIVLVSSIAGSNGGPGHAVYNATKAAVRSLARTLTAELGGRGIRANSVSPGPTATAGFDQFTGGSETVAAAVAEMVPLRRIGRPEEVAAAVAFLASAESSFIAGVDLVVDGGMSQV
ncbi:SDR family oxidoreductase [Microbacterium sp. ACRRU]|uniref:SDR family oxidoreductase n=1 Tax=Microbacterium sp. ACRRU TaxID=2918204 RepID=UPI001EF44D53|nr:SDR family oxidoreductase [Microbacterium sp. ACRRU]MCG7417508.1 SDR family oxidoreductase [Microbacterium sp. ACRRU]